MRLMACSAFVAGIVTAASATAAPVVWEFQGVVTEVVFPVNLDGSVTVGTPLSGSVSYDPLAPNVSPDPENIAIYEGISFRVLVGNYEFRSLASMPDVDVFLIDGAATDVFGINSLENEAIGFFPLFPGQSIDSLIAMQWRLSGGNSLPGMALPLQPPDLSQWRGRVLQIAADKNIVGDGLFTIWGEVTSVVPEPSAAKLLSPALFILFVSAVRMRRRRFDAKGGAWRALLGVVASGGAVGVIPGLAIAQSRGGG
jgi:hypothetical protein